MKLKGRKVEGAYIETVVIPRPDINGEPQAHIFQLQAVLDYDDFEKLLPAPPIPIKVTPATGPNGVENPEDPNYKKMLHSWFEKRTQWAFLKSIAATPDLEWDKVKMDEPETWHLVEKELQEAGFSQVEINRLYQGYAIANCLDDRKIKEARQHFLAIGPVVPKG
jgi:hypothetical protein